MRNMSFSLTDQQILGRDVSRQLVIAKLTAILTPQAGA